MSRAPLDIDSDTVRITVSMSRAQIEAIDRAAKWCGVSRSELIRSAVAAELANIERLRGEL